MIRTRKLVLVALSISAIFLANATLSLRAGETQLKQLFHEINSTTGDGPVSGQIKALAKNPEAKNLIHYAQEQLKKEPAALSYNGAWILARVAGRKKELAAAEAFYRVCAKNAADLESEEKLFDSYEGLISLLYSNKKYKECEKVCREVLELVTGPGKQREIFHIDALMTPFGLKLLPKKVEQFDPVKSLRNVVQADLVKSIAKQGKHDAAMDLAKKLAEKSKSLIAEDTYAWMLNESGRFDDAVKAYEQILAAIPNLDLPAKQQQALEDQYHYKVSSSYTDAKQPKKAIEHLRICVNHNPDEPGYLNDLGYIMADNDMNLDEAEKLIRKAIDLDRKFQKDHPEAELKDKGAYLDSMGWVLYKQKKYKEAKEWLLKAIGDENSQHIDIYDHLGDVMMALHDRDAALKYWEKGVDLADDTHRDKKRKELVQEKIEKNKQNSDK